jgi:hypothetical protein
MNPKMTVVMIAAAVGLGVVAADEARAQGGTKTTKGNLNLGISSGEPKGYAFLLPVPPRTGGVHEVHVDLRPDDTQPPPDQWTWHVDQSAAQIKSATKMTWYAQASCPDNLTLLQVTGPAGTLTQNPLQNPIWGNFATQSFTVDTVKNVCEDWANANQCDILAPGEDCELSRTFDLVGGVAPASSADRLRLKASCSSGPLPTLDYAPKMRLHCTRGQ